MMGCQVFLRGYIFIKIFQQMLSIMSKTFTNFARKISCFSGIEEAVVRAECLYSLKKYKISQIKFTNALTIYKNIIEKFYDSHKARDLHSWAENQLRLFLWSLVCYLFIHSKEIQQMTDKDWSFFSEIFLNKEISLFEYQARSMFEIDIKINRWSKEEDCMLYNIIAEDRSYKWNQIAKFLFVKSDKKFLRGSKQCRERWLNHLDPKKTKKNWSIPEYLIVFQCVEFKGKKWAKMVHKLNDRRSEHTIKNKYNSIIRKKMRMIPEIKENRARKEIITRLKQLIDNEEVDSEDQFIFGDPAKKIKQATLSMMNQLGSKVETPETIKKKLETFRRKIEKFEFCLKGKIHEQVALLSQEKQMYMQNLIIEEQKFSQMILQPYQGPHKPRKTMATVYRPEEIESQNFSSLQNEQSDGDTLNNQAMLAGEINNFISEKELDM